MNPIPFRCGNLRCRLGFKTLRLHCDPIPFQFGYQSLSCYLITLRPKQLWEPTLKKHIPIFHIGIEPFGCARFSENFLLRNWTTIFLTKWGFLTKRRRLFLIYSTGTPFLLLSVFFIRFGKCYDGLGWSTLNEGCSGFHQGIEPDPLTRVLGFHSILELNLFFCHFCSQNTPFLRFGMISDTPLPNRYHRHPQLVSFISFSMFSFVQTSRSGFKLLKGGSHIQITLILKTSSNHKKRLLLT